MKRLKPLNYEKLKYSHIIGTGGIGSGIFFKLEGNHTLGRNESRPGKLVACKDYCKQHIILHYATVLLGADPLGDFKVYPVGRVGDDEQGQSLIMEMKNVGMTVDHVLITSNTSTLFSVCFQYADSTGGNITTSENASSKVEPDDIATFFKSFEDSAGDEIILAAPEVPLPTRIKLLEKGKERGSFNVASILSSEVNEFRLLGGFSTTDLLHVNIDEAKSIAGIYDEYADSKVVVDKCLAALKQVNPSILLVVTDGPNGSYCSQNGHIEYIPALRTTAVATGGAGDAYLSGLITGLCCGLPFIKGKQDRFFSETPLECAAELGTLLASLSVTSPDTIYRDADAELLYKFAVKNKVRFSSKVLNLFSSFIPQTF